MVPYNSNQANFSGILNYGYVTTSLAQDLRNELNRLRNIYQDKLDNRNFQNASAQNLLQILNTPGIANIPFDADLSVHLGNLLLLIAIQQKSLCDDESLAIAHALLNPKIAHLIQPNGQFGLGRVLTNAAYYKNVFFVNAILSHSQACHIRSYPINVKNPVIIFEGNLDIDLADKKPLEKRWNLNKHGLTECLFAAISNEDENHQMELGVVVRTIIQFAQNNQITLHVDDSFGLAETCVAAASKYDGAYIPIILNIPESNQIMANSQNNDSGGLDNALYNAALWGYLTAVQIILNHPNAQQITREKCLQALQEAEGNSHHNVANCIRAFINNRQI